MVVDEIDIMCVTLIEAKHDAPIGGNRDRPEAGIVAFQRMQPHAWQLIDVVYPRGGIQSRQDPCNPFDLIGAYPSGVTDLEETPKPAVSDGGDHEPV